MKTHAGMKRFFLLTSALLAAALAPASVSSKGDQAITLMYFERPPYLMTESDGRASGLTGTPVAGAFKAAKIAVVWAKVPTSKQLDVVKENTSLSCGIGWFRNPEREKFAKFSKAIYRDKPWIAVASKQFLLQSDVPLEQALAMKRVRVLVKEGFSYGALSQMLSKQQPAVVSTPLEVIQMMQMIKANRADLMFAAEEEAVYLVDKAGFRLDDFNLVKFPDMPPGETRHIMCTKKVTDDVLHRLNQHIRFEQGIGLE